MRSVLLRLVSAGVIGASVAGSVVVSRAEAGDQAFGALQCVKEEHRFALAADMLLWQIDTLTAGCIDKFDDQAETLRGAKKTFNTWVEKLRQTTYATVAYEVFRPFYGDEAPKARLKYITDFMGPDTKEATARATAEDCESLSEKLGTFSNEMSQTSFGPKLSGIITQLEEDARPITPRCGS